MRHLFVAFLIALLPLRGWVSDAMAASMPANQAGLTVQVATKMAATHAHEVGATNPVDLEIEALTAIQTASKCSAHASEADFHEADLHCDSCSACQACHAVALCADATGVAAVFSLSSLPRAAAAQFASASTTLDEKPPIF